MTYENINGKALLEEYERLYDTHFGSVTLEYIACYDKWIEEIKAGYDLDIILGSPTGTNYRSKKTKALINILGLNPKNKTELISELKRIGFVPLVDCEYRQMRGVCKAPFDVCGTGIAKLCWPAVCKKFKEDSECATGQ